MKTNKIKCDNYEKFLYTITRYMDLVPCQQREKVDTISTHIIYAIHDLNSQIEKCKLKKLDVSIYYVMMIKTDFLVSCIETLYKIFYPNKKRIDIWDKDYTYIDKFRLIRSLTLAHPLETTRYEKFGFGKDNDKWCEDIRLKGKLYNSISELKDADFVMLLKQKGKELPIERPINIESDILSIVYIALEHLHIFTKEIESELTITIENLKRTPLDSKIDMNMTDYIDTLINDLKKRYPNEIEVINLNDNIKFQNCLLFEALERLTFTMTNPTCEKKYKAYKEEIKKVIYEYADSVQNMNLEETNVSDRLRIILHPNCYILNSNEIDGQLLYRCEKISQYLSVSNTRSFETAMEKLSNLTYEGCQNTGACSNTEWGIIQLYLLKDILSPFFTLDFNATDKELFIQFCTALYYANNKLVQIE